LKNHFILFGFLIFLLCPKTGFCSHQVLSRFFQGIRTSNKIKWVVHSEYSDGLSILNGQNEKSSFWLAVADPKTAPVESTYIKDNVLVPISKLVGLPCRAGINAGYFNSKGSISLVWEKGLTAIPDAKNIPRDGRILNPTRAVWVQTKNNLQGFGWGTLVNGLLYRYLQAADPALGEKHPRSDAELWVPQSALGGGPMLVYRNTVIDTLTNEVFDDKNIVPNDPAPRTAIAYTRNNLMIGFTADGRISQSKGLTIAELSEILFNLGSSYAMNLDGGASTTFVLEGNIQNRLSTPNERSVFSGICFR
jgi:hypothetical protein